MNKIRCPKCGDFLKCSICDKEKLDVFNHKVFLKTVGITILIFFAACLWLNPAGELQSGTDLALLGGIFLGEFIGMLSITWKK